MTDAHCHVSCGDPSVREFIVGRDFFGIHPWETLTATTTTLTATTSALNDPTQTPIDLDSTLIDSTQTPIDLIDSTQTLIDPNSSRVMAALRARLLANPRAGVGEIGLDRLKVRDIPPLMREVFEQQLALALELRRPVVLHGAKCWGQVVETIKNYELRIKNYGIKPPSIHNSSLPIHDSSFIIHNSFLFHGFSRSAGLIPDIVALNGYISVGPAVLNDHAVNYRELVKKIPMDRLLVETDRTDGTGVSIYDVLARTAELRGTSAAELERITDANADAFMGKMV